MYLLQKKFNVLAFFVGVLITANSYGQGCSDAGFCTMGAMKPSQIYTKKINFKLRSAEFSYGQGNTTISPKITAATVDLTFGINEVTSFQLKVPYYWVTGNLGETSGLSDISYSVTRNVYSTEQFHINATLGGKIPTNASDLDSDVKSQFITDGLPEGTSTDLPMYYQTSLGSWDLVAGASYISQKWMFATGIQIALTENENDFRYEQWAEYPDDNYLRDNFLANDLKRGTDVMLRVERAFHFSKWDIRAGLLPIFRITKDEILDTRAGSPTEGQRIKVDKTTGLAMTALLNVAYHFNTNNSISGIYGQKITDRDVNPDGLTRDNVFSIGYVVRF
ncbi:porin family protein [Fulvivirga lutea]|uniref:Uncharacterized protein n=1 Tax=Fulvivirga lutea TaxID=2810512 RepID=A0A974WFV3_9BACT|nr:hypothetical protein [Fulvivirga lutea]QSE96272.1 hypothetical protein JR347_11695 [Fulvivirga lutea]